jgi:hypothetical protein
MTDAYLQDTMMKNSLMQAYKLVPWRRQMQWIVGSLLGIVTISLVAWVYLSVASKTSIAGREIQDYQSAMNKSEQSIAAMTTNLAEITSSTQMAKRAKDLGFKELNPSKFNYMVIPNYGGKPSAKLAPEDLPIHAETGVITGDFTESLWDWMYSSYIEPAVTK